MREELVRQYAAELEIINFRPRTRKGWMETNCPLAPWTHDKGTDSGASFAIHANPTGKSWTRCLSCNHKTTFAGLAFRLFGYTGEKHFQDIGHEIERVETATMADSLPEWEEEEYTQEKEINRRFLDVGEEMQNYPPAFYYKRCTRYLRSRGIAPHIALRMNLRYHYSEDRLMFPVYDRNRELRGFSGRAMYQSSDPGHIKVKDYSGLNKEELLLGESHVFNNRGKYRFVVAVEGLLDKAAVTQAGFPNSLALFGNQLTRFKYQKLIDLNLPIVWFTDNDEGGYSCIYGPKDKETGERETNKGALHMFQGFFPQMVVKYPKKLVKADPGSLSPETIRRLIYGAEVHI